MEHLFRDLFLLHTRIPKEVLVKYKYLNAQYRSPCDACGV